MEGEMVWENYRGMPLPFRDFWIESHGVDTDTGIYFEVKSKEATADMTPVCAAVVAASHGERPLIAALTQFAVTRNGSLSLVLIDDGKFSIQTSMHPAYLRSDSVMRLGQMMVFQSLSNAFDVLMILGCKNVSLKACDNEPKQARRAAKRHGGTPDSYRYHTLVVRPPGAKSDSPGQDIGIMPRHVCRGHFAEYGPEFGKGLLFGKYAGRFFIPPHLKGDKKNGVVEKDYMVAASS